jgi:hypothetical protein
MAVKLEEARIIVVGPRRGEDSFSELVALPAKAKIVAHGATMEELLESGDEALASANVRIERGCKNESQLAAHVCCMDVNR